MNRLTILLIFASLCFGLPASADERAITDLDRFKLWNNCEPMMLVVEKLSDDATEIGLTREAVLTTVRSRLRAARLYSDQHFVSGLYVNVNVVSQSVNVYFGYRKLVRDFASGVDFFAITWHIGSSGIHSQDSSFILSSVSQLMDNFIDDYLRVNASACKP